MSVLTIRDLIPPARYDEPTPLAWVEARVEESTAATGETWTELDTITLDPVEPDPTSPITRNLTVEDATEGLWYRVVFVDADGDEALPTQPLYNEAASTTYASVDELKRILFKNATATSAQRVAMHRVLVAAAGEIDAELGRGTATPLSGWELSLAAEVNLERAVEHWQQQELPWGVIGLGDAGAIRTATDTWKRHGEKLSPLKRGWGIA